MANAGSATIELFVGETRPVSKTCIDSDGSSVSLAGLTLEIVIEDSAGADVQVIEAVGIAISGAGFTFTPSASVTAAARTLHWSLRQTSDNKVLMYGLIPVNYAASDDP